MIRIGIVDDEKLARITLRALLSKIEEDITIVFDAEDVESAQKTIAGNPIDLLFLDINLQTGTGFNLLELMPDRAFEVVFVTACDKYAIEAFQFAAMNYILKPVKLSDLRECIRRYYQRASASIEKAQQEVLFNNLKYKDLSKLKISLPCSGDYFVVKINEIIRLEAYGNYTWFYLSENRKHLISKSMKEYETQLSNHGFFRIHQSHIINLDQVVKYTRLGGGEVVLSDGSRVPIARNRKEEFIRLFKPTRPHES